MKKILILTASFGDGHLTASMALKEGFESLGRNDLRVEIVDFVTTSESILTSTMSKAYKQLVRYTPRLYRLIYQQGDRKLWLKFLTLISHPFLENRLREIFQKENPDLIISTFPLWNYFVQKVLEKSKCRAQKRNESELDKYGGMKALPGPRTAGPRASEGLGLAGPKSERSELYYFDKKISFATVITDTLYRHVGTGAWLFSKHDDVYFVPNKDTAATLRQKNIPKNKIKIFGFPMRQNGYAKTLARHSNRTSSIFLVIFNTGAVVSTSKKFILKLDSMEEENFEVLVIAGKNEKLKKQLEALSLRHRAKILGWVEPLAPYLETADIIFTKAGGAITMECIAAKKPMVITQVIPGQEEANAVLVEKNHLGIVLHAKSDLHSCVREILSNYSFYTKNQEKIAKPNANIDIARYSLSLMRE